MLHGKADLAPVWLQRLSLGMLVIFCLYIGGLVTILPWSPRYWDGNGWILGHPAAAHWLLRGWVRGLLSGIPGPAPLDKDRGLSSASALLRLSK